MNTTRVQGYILANTTWTLTGSPYIITEDVIVDQNVFVTVEPGVIVKFDQGKTLLIDGSLIAIGSPSQIITFTSSLLTPTPACYEGIQVRGSDVSPANITLEYARIEYAKYAIYFQENSTFTIKHATFQSNVVGLLGRSEPYRGAKGFLEDFRWYGVFKDLYYQTRNLQPPIELPHAIFQIKDLVINDSLISGAGINSVGRLQMNNCTVTGIVAPGVVGDDIITYRAINAEEATIVDSRIVSNIDAGGVSGGALYMHDTEVYDQINLTLSHYVGGVLGVNGEITNCIMRNGGGGVTGLNATEIRSCVITDNDDVGVYVYGTSRVVDCIISRNRQGGVKGDTGSVEHCIVTDNGLFGISAVEAAMGYQFTVHNSNIYNDSDYLLIHVGSNSVNATYNWWGTTNETLIDQGIYDYYDNPNIGRVYYTPFLTSPIPNDPIPPEIENINLSTTTPDQQQAVTVTATIVDDVAVSKAILSYSTDSVWQNITMTQTDSTFKATIPPQPAGTKVYYEMLAEDTSGNCAYTNTYSYSITGAGTPPWIIIVVAAVVVIILAAALAGLWLRRSRRKH